MKSLVGPPGKPSLISRIMRLDREKIGRHAAYATKRLICKLERQIGLSYPKWIDIINTHMTIVEKHFLFRMAKQLPAKSVLVEIGSYYGASSCCLVAGISGGEGKLYCIDTFMNDAVSDDRDDVYPIWKKNTELYVDRIVAVRGFSHEVVEMIPDHISLLFIDGDHSYDAVKRDILYYLPKLKREGL